MPLTILLIQVIMQTQMDERLICNRQEVLDSLLMQLSSMGIVEFLDEVCFVAQDGLFACSAMLTKAHVCPEQHALSEIIWVGPPCLTQTVQHLKEFLHILMCLANEVY